MSIERQVSVRGMNVFFTLGSKTNAEQLKESLRDLGLERFVPDGNTKKSALKQALTSVCANRRRLVRSLPKGQRGYAVVTENQDENGKSLDHTVDFNVLLPDENGEIKDPVFMSPKMDCLFSPVEEGKILHRYQIELDRLPAHKLSSSIVRILDYYHAISLRPTGGIYWLPGKAKIFKAVARAVEEASEDRSNVVFFQTTAMDEELNRTVIDNLRRTLSEEASAIEEEAVDGNMQKRAIKTKEARCSALRSRILGYKKIFGVALDDLEDSLEKAEGALVAAAFQGLGAK